MHNFFNIFQNYLMAQTITHSIIFDLAYLFVYFSPKQKKKKIWKRKKEKLEKHSRIHYNHVYIQIHTYKRIRKFFFRFAVIVGSFIWKTKTDKSFLLSSFRTQHFRHWEILAIFSFWEPYLVAYKLIAIVIFINIYSLFRRTETEQS